ncbi:aminoacyl-tRNA hydrolase [Opitutus sp. ER46]|uniref:aminoacyl-tRNA hydrolase n=1 Tax=Opitutus sp. ER46 TaxID=2161864 RepID=UPI000D322F4C|nr:aminoacyl-tRNA hydrolase [Opitutus sp. ER46]PTX96497.1 aminoacyl-tRNA hydrolase [Opitutus sp. ER46]
MSISLVAGLGNPGRGYELTRHNLGWIVVDALARKHGLVWKAAPQFEAEIARWDTPAGTCWLVKPQTFMNASGRSVGAMARFYKIEPADIAVAYDDLTIDLGLIKVTASGSAGGHNGVASLLEHVGNGFARYRLGIGPKDPPQMDMADFVLGKFTPDQHILVTQKLDQYVSGLDLLLARGVEVAMNQLNRRDQK